MTKLAHVHTVKSVTVHSLYSCLYNRVVFLVVLQQTYISVPPRLHVQPEQTPSALWELTQLKNCFFFNVLLFLPPFFLFFIIHDSTASVVMENDGSEKGTGKEVEEHEC